LTSGPTRPTLSVLGNEYQPKGDKALQLGVKAASVAHYACG